MLFIFVFFSLNFPINQFLMYLIFDIILVEFLQI